MCKFAKNIWIVQVMSLFEPPNGRPGKAIRFNSLVEKETTDNYPSLPPHAARLPLRESP